MPETKQISRYISYCHTDIEYYRYDKKCIVLTVDFVHTILIALYIVFKIRIFQLRETVISYVDTVIYHTKHHLYTLSIFNTIETTCALYIY